MIILAAAHHAAHVSNAKGWAILIVLAVLAFWVVSKRWGR